MNLPEWFVGMTGVSDVSGSGVGQHSRWTYSMIGIPFSGESELTEYVLNQRSVSKQEGGITSIITWTFAPHEGGTKLDMHIDYTIPVPVLGKLAEKSRVQAQPTRSPDVDGKHQGNNGGLKAPTRESDFQRKSRAKSGL